MTEITADQMPTKEQLLEVYIDTEVNVQRYLDTFVESQDHARAYAITKYSIQRRTVTRADALDVPLADLCQQAGPRGFSIAECLDLVSYGDAWQDAVQHLIEVTRDIGTISNLRREYVHLRSAYPHEEALSLLQWLEVHWSSVADLSMDDVLRQTKTIARLGRAGLPSQDIITLIDNQLLTRWWVIFGDAIVDKKVTLNELLKVTEARGHAHRYLVAKKRFGDILIGYPIEEIAKATQNRSTTEIKRYVELRIRGLDDAEASRQAFKFRYRSPDNS